MHSVRPSRRAVELRQAGQGAAPGADLPVSLPRPFRSCRKLRCPGGISSALWQVPSPRPGSPARGSGTSPSACSVPASTPPSPGVLSAEQLRELDALTALIIPTDDAPGAREARVVDFIDQGLGSFASDQRPPSSGVWRTSAPGPEPTSAATVRGPRPERSGRWRWSWTARSRNSLRRFASPPSPASWPIRNTAVTRVRRAGSSSGSRTASAGSHLSATTTVSHPHGSATARSGPRPRFSPKDPVDFVIVGAGAAGGVVARELARAGSGSSSSSRARIYAKKTFATTSSLSPRSPRSPTTPGPSPTRSAASETEEAKPRPVVQYGRLVGGGSVHFTANYWRFHEIDFIERSRKGSSREPALPTGRSPTPSWSRTTAGWSGRSACPDSPAPAPSTRRAADPIPLPPCRSNRRESLPSAAARKLGWHAFPRPDGDPFGALPRPAALHSMRLLQDVRVRSRCQVEHPCCDDSGGGGDRDAARSGPLSYVRKIELDTPRAGSPESSTSTRLGGRSSSAPARSSSAPTARRPRASCYVALQSVSRTGWPTGAASSAST